MKADQRRVISDIYATIGSLMLFGFVLSSSAHRLFMRAVRLYVDVCESGRTVSVVLRELKRSHHDLPLVDSLRRLAVSRGFEMTLTTVIRSSSAAQGRIEAAVGRTEEWRRAGAAAGFLDGLSQAVATTIVLCSSGSRGQLVGALKFELSQSLLGAVADMIVLSSSTGLLQAKGRLSLSSSVDRRYVEATRILCPRCALNRAGPAVMTPLSSNICLSRAMAASVLRSRNRLGLAGTLNTFKPRESFVRKFRGRHDRVPAEEAA